ncbi:Fic family protein [Pseudoxanthomonas sp. JBR18]|uniref:Fic family protein n=1 Tax=Pseudoxanthomonas sp. JBR18 TaxID=2969308 RepID=UPI002306A69E|nr:Fic family protein [Pseudoxanthomonas sp. JBR18]WCE03478.1 Fic family protein [Pseudoxanthomonas sp. JBR18]
MDIKAKLIVFPAIEALPPEVLIEADFLEAHFRNADHACMERAAHWVSLDARQRIETGLFSKAELAHRLSPFVASNKTEFKDDSRTQLEYSFLNSNVFPRAATLSADVPLGFMEFCLWLRASLGDLEDGFRTRSVTTLPDRIGSKIVYPDAGSIAASLEEVAATWSRINEVSAGLAAAYCLVALMTVHPFLDGNGRLARVFFNWHLNDARVNKVYLPIYETSAISDGGYILRVREAQYHNNWLPLLRYLNLISERFFSTERQGSRS